MKKTIFFAIILSFLLIPIMAVTSSAEYYNMKLEDMRSQSYLLVNVDTDTVVFSQNADERLKCASLVKTAVAILTVEKCNDLDAVVTVSQSALDPLKGLYSASCDLEAGEQMTVRNLLYCMMMKNANDAANVLAEYIGGSIPDFVKMMNDLAAEVGCQNTNFTNPTGLDEEGEYTSANDMYLLTKRAIGSSVLSDIASTVDYIVPATNMSEERKLNTGVDIVELGSRYYYEYAKGFKVGHTDESKRCAAVVATKDAYSYIGIVLGCPNECIDDCGYPDNTALYEARRMLRWAFRELRMTTVAAATDTLTDIPVALSSETDHVRLVPEKQIQALLLSTVDKSSLEFIYETQTDVQAPIEKGTVLGTVQVKYADSVIATANLVAGDSVKRSNLLYFGYLIKNIVTSPVFLIIFGVTVAGVLLYIFSIYTKHQKKQYETRKRLREIKQGNYADAADLSEVEKRKSAVKKK